MTTDLAVFKSTMKANDDMSGDQFKFVNCTAADTADTCDAATEIPIGVLYNKPSAAGDAAEIALGPIVKVQADAAVVAGAMVGTSADGQAVTKSTADDHVFGVALTACSNAGEIIMVLVQSGKIHA